MRTSKLLGFVCAGFVALAMGAPHAGASTLTPTGGYGPPTLQPNSSPSVEQKNINAPLSFLSLDSNNGDVHQSNTLGTSSGDNGKQDGKQYGSVENDHQCNCDQSYVPKHDDNQNRGDKNRGDTGQGGKDRNNCGCDQHRRKHKDHKDHHNKDRGDTYQGNQGGTSCGCNNQGPKPEGDYGQNKYQGNQGGTSCGCNNQGPKPEGDYGQNKYQGNQGGTSCGCDYQGGQGYQPNNQGDHPEVKQVNVNAPISILSVDSNNGDVQQSNNADSSSKWSGQGTEQKNVNAPVSILSVDSNNGDVQQSNNADSSSKSSDCGCNQKSYGSDGGSSYGGSQDGGSYGGGGNGSPLSAPTGGLPVVGSLLGGSSGGGSVLGL